MVITTQNLNQKPGYKQTEIGMIPEDWEIKLIEDISNPVRGGSPRPAGSPRYFNGDYIPWLTVASLTNISPSQIFVSETEGYLTKEGSHYSRTLDKETVIIANSGATLGIAKLLSIKCCANDGIAALLNVSDRIDKRFLVYYINSLTKRLRDVVATGNGQPNLNTELIGNIQIPLPPLSEQRAIATVLSNVDTLITSLDRLIAKKHEIKQATMQQLLTGKTRLPGFSGEWKVKNVEEIGEKFVNGGTPSTQKFEYWQGNIPWITGADIINQKISDIRRFITTEAVKNSSTNIVERGNLLLVTRTGVGKLAVAPFDVAISQDITGICVKKEQASIEYLFHYFNYSSETLKSLNQGTSIAGITRETLLFTKVYLPSLSEQQAIAAILSDMDAEITALEQKRDKTIALKQGMMQELLTGKTRLV